jgi:hypothetical protein
MLCMSVRSDPIFYKQSGNTDTGFDYTEPKGDVVIECQESMILKLLVK